MPPTPPPDPNSLGTPGTRRGKKGPPQPPPPPPPPLTQLPGEADDDFLRQFAEKEREALLQFADLAAGDYIPASQAEQLRALLAERARRKIESLRQYEPLPAQAEFHKSTARIRVLRGSNRGGKTLPAAVEVARAVTGRDPHNKYPKENGRWYCVAKDLKELGEVMWPKLAKAGAFKIIRDLQTGLWRAYRPWDPADAVREGEVKRAPPLIPPRLIKGISWHNKGEGQPSLVRLHNGWELSFYSSLGKPPHGSDINGWWFDEEIVDGEWLPEMSARILDRHGCGIWSATPQAGTEQLFELHERAERERHRENPSCREFFISLANNPHITDQAKKALAEDLQSEEEYRVRIEGEFAITSFKVYPEFRMEVHGVDWFEIPGDWCRYAIVDPGHQVCAVLFAAVPPPGHGNHVYLYDELYLRDCDAIKFAEAMARKAVGQTIQAFIIDPNMAAYTEVGIGKTVLQQYTDALREKRVASVATGHSFHLAMDDITAGVLKVHGWLRVREDGKPKLLVLRDALPNFEWEVKRYYKKRENGMVTDKPNQKRNNHLMDDLRYLAMYDPKYIRPKGRSGKPDGALAALRAKQQRARERNGPRSVNLGPGSGNA